MGVYKYTNVISINIKYVNIILTQFFIVLYKTETENLNFLDIIEYFQKITILTVFYAFFIFKIFKAKSKVNWIDLMQKLSTSN